jgi:hypothetical protein
MRSRPSSHGSVCSAAGSATAAASMSLAASGMSPCVAPFLAPWGAPVQRRRSPVSGHARWKGGSAIRFAGLSNGVENQKWGAFSRTCKVYDDMTELNLTERSLQPPTSLSFDYVWTVSPATNWNIPTEPFDLPEPRAVVVGQARDVPVPLLTA